MVCYYAFSPLGLPLEEAQEMADFGLLFYQYFLVEESSCPSPDLPGEGGACESTLTLSIYVWHPGTVVLGEAPIPKGIHSLSQMRPYLGPFFLPFTCRLKLPAN
ncbi:hypothetical protein LIER_43756 [Lithospermum erythrorhizon]|uniref:Uncharacterized protein n=1 Tax=Lithospermum erythrorhizon TaxID=34254 RepID=A0AAV3QQT2_LITER